MSSGDPTLREIFLEFASLGDNCEFGLVQRGADAEPLDLLRFAGFYIPVEHRLERLIGALASRFEGLGEPATIKPYLDGEAGRREWLVKESAYDLMYHTFHREGSTDADAIRQREVKRLKFLRDKLFVDLETAERIWVWRSGLILDIEAVQALHKQLRAFGPNRLLWVVEADAANAAGKVEWVDVGLMKGYVERFAPYSAATEIAAESWHLLCQNAYELFNLPQPSVDRPVTWIPWLLR